MKTLFTLLALVLAMFAPVAMADGPDMLMGCEIVPAEGGGFYVKADNTCEFSTDINGGKDDAGGEAGEEAA